jgi:hypothetical protein
MDKLRPGSDAETPLSGNLLEFLVWVAARPRTYAETMEAWRTSCPRLPAWEDANEMGLVRIVQGASGKQGQATVLLTEQGTDILRRAQLGQGGPDMTHRGKAL